MVQQGTARRPRGVTRPVRRRIGAALRPGEVSLDELERAFRETPGPCRSRRRAERAPRAKSRVAEDDDRTDSKVANKSIRVSVDTLEHLMTMVSELVLTRNQLLDIVRRHDDSEFKVPLQRLSNVTAELQDGVMRTRMQPIGNAWQKLPRIVRDLPPSSARTSSSRCTAPTPSSTARCSTHQGSAHHMVRNSADHGSRRRGRIAAGKPEKGTIRLSAYHEGGHIIIGVADDGRGLDTARSRRRRWPAGSRPSRARQDVGAQIQKFIFAPASRPPRRHQRVRPRRRHGRGAQQYRPDRRQHRRASRCRARAELHHQDPADARDRLGADRRGGGERFAIPQLAVVELVRVQRKSEHRIERIKDARCCGCATSCCRWSARQPAQMDGRAAIPRTASSW
jgi:two-component system chemotaxis sensor kinase CheA